MMDEQRLAMTLDDIAGSLRYFHAELFLTIGIVLIVVAGLVVGKRADLIHSLALAILATTLVLEIIHLHRPASVIFSGMFRTGNTFGDYLKILFAGAGVLTLIMTWRHSRDQVRLSEYYALILTLILGGNLLVMSENLVIVFLALELISIPSYVLTGFAFTQRSSEGSLKYFLFGSISSAIMLYGFTLLYGVFGTLNFTEFHLPAASAIGVFYFGGALALVGFLFKMAAAPMHPWAPDVYEAAPMPIVALFSVVPKLAGAVILFKFVLYSIPAGINWQMVLSIVAMLTLTAGNFAALWQKGVKRLMAYSSIAQSGFLLAAIATCSLYGAEAFLFYSTVYLLLVYVVFIYLHPFENRGFTTIASFENIGRQLAIPSVLLLIAFVGLTGLPPTGGFTGKLFIFSALWDAYGNTGKQVLLWLFIFGLLNTVVSLFYYLRIPYYAFIRRTGTPPSVNNLGFENLLALFLVLLVLILFFSPQLLMGWINKSNFVF